MVAEFTVAEFSGCPVFRLPYKNTKPISYITLSLACEQHGYPAALQLYIRSYACVNPTKPYFFGAGALYHVQLP